MLQSLDEESEVEEEEKEIEYQADREWNIWRCYTGREETILQATLQTQIA